MRTCRQTTGRAAGGASGDERAGGGILRRTLCPALLALVAAASAPAQSAEPAGPTPRMEGGAAAQATSAGNRLDQLEKAVEQLNARMGRATQAPTQLNSVEKRLTDLERKVTQLERETDQLSRRLQRLETKK